MHVFYSTALASYFVQNFQFHTKMYIHFNELVGHGPYGTVHKNHSIGMLLLYRIPVPNSTDASIIIADNQEVPALRSKL